MDDALLLYHCVTTFKSLLLKLNVFVWPITILFIYREGVSPPIELLVAAKNIFFKEIT